MTKLKFLALTDHKKHSGQNSIYALLAKLSQHPNCELVHVASRENKENHHFFYEYQNSELFVTEIDANLKFDSTNNLFSKTTLQTKISDYDAILMRLPRPLSDNFLHFLAEIAKNQVIINHPLGIVKTSDKSFLLNFPEITPPTKICKSIEEILEFAKQFPIVLKPLRGYGGQGIVKIDGENLSSENKIYATKTFLKNIENEIVKYGMLAVKFLKNVREGDKRIIVIGGDIIAASLRMPPKDSWICNVAQGGKSIITNIEPEEQEIAKILSKPLEENGVFIFGIDTLVGDDGKRLLSEINTLSVGGFPQAEEQTGKPIVQMSVDKIVKYVESKRN